MALKALSETPEEFWGNTILFKLAVALGYPWVETHGDPRTITAEPDEVLEEALEAIQQVRAVRRYAQDRAGYRLGTVSSVRIASDLNKIVGGVEL